jgi:hypothetical protein
MSEPVDKNKETQELEPAIKRIRVEDKVVLNPNKNAAKGFKVPFSIAPSHGVKSIGFKGENSISWPTPFNQSITFEPIGNVSVEITRPKSDEYLLQVTTERQITEANALTLVSALEVHLAFLLNRKNPNPHYGTFSVSMDLHDFDLKYSDHGLHVTESLGVRMEGKYNPEPDDWKRFSISEILKCYGDGTRASEAKSKFFQWFRIIELLEGSQRYRTQMGWSPLFSGIEQNLLGAVADIFANERKNSIVRDLFGRTTQARHEKLALFLKALGIEEYGFAGQKTPVSSNHLKQIITARNNLFHAGSNFDEKLLWQHLFPLVTAIANAEHSAPLVLNL